MGSKLNINSDYIEYKISNVNDINKEHIERINNNRQLGLVELEISQFNDEISLIFPTSEMRKLTEYLSSPLSKENAYNLLESINNNFIMLQNELTDGRLILEKDLVYVKENNDIPRVYFIYIPGSAAMDLTIDVPNGGLNNIILGILIDISDNELRSECIKEYQNNGLEKVLDILNINDKPDFRLNIEQKEVNETTLLENSDDTVLLTSSIASVVVYSDNKPIKTILHNQKTVIGRAINCNIVINSKIISKEHAQIVQVGDEYYLSDLGSKNGTIINNVRISTADRVKLKSGDKFLLGNINCEFIK